MAKRKKRRPGGGRKPQGEVSGLRSVMSFRLPTEMRDELAKAAQASGNSVTQEVLSRLGRSFKEDRKNYRDPATKALCFLFSDLAENTHMGTPNWRADPYLFRAFTVAVPKLLAALQPPGKPQTPRLLKALLAALSTDDPMNKTKSSKAMRERCARMMKSPEALAGVAVDATLSAFFRPSQRHKEWEPWREEIDAKTAGFFSEILRHQKNTYYGMEAAKRDLDPKPRGRKS